MAKVVISGGTVVLEGVHRVLGDNSLIAALGAALEAIGAPVPYEDLMGWSGAAFRLQLSQPDWTPSAARAATGFNCVTALERALSRQFRIVHVADREMAIQVQIDKGRPLVFDRDEARVVIGYRNEGMEALLLGRDVEPVWESVDTWTYESLYVLMNATTDDRSLRTRAIAAIGQAVRLMALTQMRDPGDTFAWLSCGTNAYRCWAAQVCDPRRFAEPAPEADAAADAILSTLRDARMCAAVFLLRLVPVLGGLAERHLMLAATKLRKVSDNLRQLSGATLSSATSRRDLADILLCCANLEEDAESELRLALTSAVLA